MKYTIISTSWNRSKLYLREIRRRVFIEEQHVPEHLEWDEYDETSFHILVVDEKNNPIGTGRLKPDGQIGRMAVAKEWRNRGIGREILRNIMEQAKSSDINRVYLNAQTSAIPFYKKHGFTVCGAEFIEAGIPHVAMNKTF